MATVINALMTYAPLLGYLTLILGVPPVSWQMVKFFINANVNLETLTKTVVKLENNIEKVFGEQDKMRESISFLQGVAHGKEQAKH